MTVNHYIYLPYSIYKKKVAQKKRIIVIFIDWGLQECIQKCGPLPEKL